MRSADREVLATAADWLDAGHGVYLVTVARTWGSSPRPPGSLLAVRADDARFVGSVSGGCVEDDLSARLAAGGASQALPRIERYGVTPEQTHRVGLACGGRRDLVVERPPPPPPVRTAGPVPAVVAQMAQALDYEVIVCDPREEYAAQWQAGDAALDTRSPDDAVRALVRDARSAVLALTHDPRLDDLALMEALVSPAFYVGAPGSA